MSGVREVAIPKLWLPLAARWVGEDFVRLWREREQTQWESAVALQERQLRGLRALLDHAARKVPFWRLTMAEAGLTTADFQSVGDLQRLPATSKAFYTEQGAGQVCAEDLPPGKAIANSTSGTSGTPFAFVMDKALTAVKHANFFRSQTAAGIRFGERALKLWGPHDDPLTKQVFEKLVLGRVQFSAFAIDNNWEGLSRLLRGFRPRHLEAYASAAVRLAQAAEERGFDHHFDTVTVSAEPIIAGHRKLLEQVFTARVYNRYGSREFGTVGFECEHHSGLHLCMEDFVVEVVDENGRQLPPGEEGRLLITCLANRAMPFIRYEIGDRAALLPDVCPCGRGSGLLGPISGRTTDFLRFPSGKVVAYLYFNYFFEQYGDRLKEFQVTQTEPSRVQLSLVPKAQLTAADESEILARLQEYLGPEVNLALERVSAVPLTSAGKRQCVRSLVS